MLRFQAEVGGLRTVRAVGGLGRVHPGNAQDQDLAVVADLPDMRSSESGSDFAEQNEWNATLELRFHTTSWRQGSCWQRVLRVRAR